jgi:uncharacterized spore protein YtfJ
MSVMEHTSVKELAAQVREAATVHGVFGEPVVANGVTVVPVAVARGAGGAGGGHNAQGEDGEGGGFAMTGRPVGAYVMDGTSVRWRPAVDLDRLISAVATVTVLYLLTHRRRSGAAG